MLKIRISYETPEQLEKVLELLKPIIIRHKETREKDGRFYKSYIDAK